MAALRFALDAIMRSLRADSLAPDGAFLYTVLPACIAGLLSCVGRVPDAHAAAMRGIPRALRPMRPDSLENNGWERDSDLVAVELDLTVDVSRRTIRGRARNQLLGLVDETRTIRLHAVGLSIDAVTDSRGRALPFRCDAPWLEIQLAEPLMRGADETLTIDYSAAPQRGLYFVDSSKDASGFAPQVWSQGQPEDTRRWIPTWDYPSDRARFEARVRIGQDLLALSNGILLGVEDHGGGEHTFHWKLEQEIPTYLIALAAGRFERYADQWRGIPVEYYVGPGTGESKARAAFGETPEMLEYFSQLLDAPFPYQKYAQVAVANFVMGGMENASLTFQTDDILTDPDEALDGDGDPRLLVAHELAHQWFGDLVTGFGWSNLWLNEGWASYFELLFEEHKDGRESLRLWLERYRAAYLARGPATRLPLSESWRSQATGSRCNHEYDKGPWVLYMIHQSLGDQPFWCGVRSFLDRHQNGFVTSEDLWRAIFDATGRNVAGMIEQWVEGGGHPVFRATFDLVSARAGQGPLSLHVEQIQETDDLVPLFDLPLVVELVFDDDTSARHTLHVSERAQTFELPLDACLVDLVLDADCTVLCEIELRKDDAMWVRQSRARENAAVRWRAVEALSSRLASSALAREAVIERLLRDPEPLLRARAAQACRPPSMRTALIAALERDTEACVRRACARALEGSEPTAAEIARIEACLARERSPATRASLLRSLGRVDETP